MSSYKCELCGLSFNSKYSLSNHSRTKHSMKISSDEIQEKECGESFENPDEITDEDWKQVLDEAEFDDFIAREFGNKDKPKSEVEESEVQVEERMRVFVKRILTLAKEKAFLKKKVNKIEQAKKNR